MVSENKTFRITKAEYRKRKVKGRVLSVFCIIIGVVVCFSIGFSVRNNEGLMNRLGFPYDNNNDTIINDSSSRFISSIFEIEQVFSSIAVYGFDEEMAIKNITDALSQSTSDPYFKYYTPSQYLSLQNEIANADTTYGVGVLFADDNGLAYAADVFSNSPASRAGVVTGDFVESINGDKNNNNWTAQDVSLYLSNHPNEMVNILWGRVEGTDKSKIYGYNTRLKVSPSKIDNVVSSMDQNIGVVKINQLSEDTATMVKDSVIRLQTEGATSFILDLRDCVGGYASVAKDVVDLFVDSGTVYTLKTATKDQEFQVTGNIITDKPVVVLTNANTSGEPEIIAGALKNRGVSQNVGETTAGNLSVQATVALSNGGAIRLTCGYYLIGENKDTVESSGIKPTVAITSQKYGDPQYNYAKQIAQNMSF